MALKGAGGKPLVQDPATASVEGMPDAVLRRGIVTHGQPLQHLARLITHWVTQGTAGSARSAATQDGSRA